MHRVAAVIAGIFILTPTLAWSDWQYAHWGAKPEELAQASGGAVKVLAPEMRKTHAEPWNSETAAEGTYVDGDLQLSLSFSFDLKSGGLNCIVFTSLAKSPDTLVKQMFVGLNGPPQTSNDYKDLGMQTFSWSTENDQVGLTLMGDGNSFATQCVPGTNPPFD